MRRSLCHWLCLPLLAVLMTPVFSAAARSDNLPEVSMPDEQYKKLDTFEEHSLRKADEAFAKEKFEEAAAAYDAFILQFPRSKAIPYALLRKARCVHLLTKRFEAIKEYDEVLDYFPNHIPYAAPALYYQGMCHWQNSDEEKALRNFEEMARDEDYSKHPFAADAINKLAGTLWKNNKHGQAVKYYWQVSVEFRHKNRDAADHASDRVMYYYIKINPDEPKLREFYLENKGFDDRPRKVDAETLDTDDRYWGRIRNRVNDWGRHFNDVQKLQRKRFYGYWAEKLDGHFAKWDDYQVDVADWYLKSGGNRQEWFERIDGQFEQYQEPGDFNRIIKWIGIYRHHKDKYTEYYKKIDFQKMSFEQKFALMRTFYDSIKDGEAGRNVFNHINLGKLKDKQRQSLARFFWWKDPKLVERVCASFDDKDLGRYELLQFCHRFWKQHAEQGIKLADELSTVPEYAGDVLWKKAEMLEWTKQYPLAIQAYRAADREPEGTFAVAACYAKWGKIDQAVGELEQLERFDESSAPKARIQIARYYGQAGRKKEYIASLRMVMTKYTNHPVSREAHERLEDAGVRIYGGKTDRDKNE